MKPRFFEFIAGIAAVTFSDTSKGSRIARININVPTTDILDIIESDKSLVETFDPLMKLQSIDIIADPKWLARLLNLRESKGITAPEMPVYKAPDTTGMTPDKEDEAVKAAQKTFNDAIETYKASDAYKAYIADLEETNSSSEQLIQEFVKSPANYGTTYRIIASLAIKGKTKYTDKNGVEVVHSGSGFNLEKINVLSEADLFMITAQRTLAAGFDVSGSDVMKHTVQMRNNQLTARERMIATSKRRLALLAQDVELEEVDIPL